MSDLGQNPLICIFLVELDALISVKDWTLDLDDVRVRHCHCLAHALDDGTVLICLGYVCGKQELRLDQNGYALL